MLLSLFFLAFTFFFAADQSWALPTKDASLEKDRFGVEYFKAGEEGGQKKTEPRFHARLSTVQRSTPNSNVLLI